MSIVEIRLGHDATPILQSMSPEDYTRFVTEFKDFKYPAIKEEIPSWMSYSMFGTEEDFWALCKLDLKPKAARIRGLIHDSLPHVADHPKSGALPQIVNISVPNASLMAVQSITWVEDACTQQIQTLLDKNWRIVAVCPPNDTRRPTYIMGHFNKGEFP